MITINGCRMTNLLESPLILATAEPLCLDPSIDIICTANRLLCNKQKINMYPMKQCFRSILGPLWINSRICVIVHLLLSQNYLISYEKISKAGNCVDLWKWSPYNLAIPSEVDVEKYAKVKKSVKSDDSQPKAWPAHDIRDRLCVWMWNW